MFFLNMGYFFNVTEMSMVFQVSDGTIYRYLDTPFEPVVSIKDDEHIVAFRSHKEAGKMRLEIFHRMQK